MTIIEGIEVAFQMAQLRAKALMEWDLGKATPNKKIFFFFLILLQLV